MFGLEPGGYRRNNAFWHSYALADLIESEDEPLRTDLKAQTSRIKARYDGLSGVYQSGKDKNDIPLA